MSRDDSEPNWFAGVDFDRPLRCRKEAPAPEDHPGGTSHFVCSRPQPLPPPARSGFFEFLELLLPFVVAAFFVLAVVCFLLFGWPPLPPLQAP